jgi:hypothetical protein
VSIDPIRVVLEIALPAMIVLLSHGDLPIARWLVECQLCLSVALPDLVDDRPGRAQLSQIR